MLTAYHSLIKIKIEKKVFLVYINLKTSLEIEPLYLDRSSDSFWFNQWLFYKVYKGIYDVLKLIHVAKELPIFKKKISSTRLISNERVDEVIGLLELEEVELFNKTDDKLTIKNIRDVLSEFSTENNRSRCVLFFDDAGHAFSPIQQSDFFDFFREIRNKMISPTSAVYPGVTNYSSSFHIGHDAEEIDVWVKPSSDYF